MVGIPSNNKDGNPYTRVIAPAMAGSLEIAFFHPFDTVAKRLMSNTARVSGATMGETMHNLNKHVFKKHAESGFVSKVAYLYPGSLYAIVYKVLQRVYKFAGQPIVKDAMDRTIGESMNNTFGSKSKILTESLAGSLVGIGEVLLLPLDRLKVLSQTNEAALANRSVFNVLRAEGMGMYAGTVVTMARNAPGSFCLFGGTAFVKDIVFGLEDYRSATFAQNLAASAGGAVLSITVTNPMDVVKTRIQNKNFGAGVSGATVIASIAKNEGFSALFKGCTPKVLASAPKLIFAYTMTEYFIKMFSQAKRPVRSVADGGK